jgi:hypothetical protein
VGDKKKLPGALPLTLEDADVGAKNSLFYSIYTFFSSFFMG